MVELRMRRLDDRTAHQLRTVAEWVEWQGLPLSAYLNAEVSGLRAYRTLARSEKFSQSAKTMLNWHLRSLWREDPNSIEPNDEVLRSRSDLIAVLSKHPKIADGAEDYVLAIEEAVARRCSEIKEQPPLPMPRLGHPGLAGAGWSRR